MRDDGGGRSHWVAAGPLAVAVEWDAEIINEVENKVIGWRSLPGSDVVTAGSVNFDTVRGGREHPGHRAPAIRTRLPARPARSLATLFGREPSQTIREDLAPLKQLLEAGEIAQAVARRHEERR